MMKQISKLIKCVPVAIIWLLSTPLFAQNVQVNFASNRDSVGIEGEIVRVPILLDTVYTNDMVGENIIALNIEFSHGAELTPQSFDFVGGLIETWSINTTISGTNRFKITAAGVNPIALDSGLLFYVDYLLNDVTNESNPTFTLYTSTGADNYFNEGGYDFTMDYGQIKIKPILQLSTSASPTLITVGDSTRINASGGTAPYTYALVDPTFGSIVSDEYFLADRHGFAEVNVVDANGLEGSTLVEVRAFELDLKAPEEQILPNENGVVYVTTTDLSSLDIISGEFKFYLGNNTNIQFLNADATGFLLEDYSIEVVAAPSNQYQVAFAGTSSIGVGDTLMALHFSVYEEPVSTSAHVYVVNNTMTFNEDLLGNNGPGSSVRIVDLVEPTISRPSGNYIAGDQIQFTGSGGSEPYSWSVSDETIATIDPDGLLTVLQGGMLTVTITDDLGATKENLLNLYDGRLDIANHSAPVGSQYLLPIELTELPSGRDFSAFSFDFTYDTSKVTFMGAVKANALTTDFTIVENALNGVKHRVVGGNTAGINGPGDFIYLNFLLDKIAEGETTHITLNEIQFNEGAPIAFPVNGSIKAAISPTTHDTTLVIDEDELYTFLGDDFPFDHPNVDRTLASVRFLSLPDQGTLNYFSSPVSINQSFAISSLANVTYQSSQDESGATYASIEFVVLDDANVESNYSAFLTFDVNAVNDAPSFIVSENTVSVDEDFVDPVVIQLTADALPADEAGETISYSIDPTTLDFADIVFDPVNLTLTISAIENGFGSEVITITSDDGQGENSTFNQELSVSINSVNDIPTMADQTFTIEENLGSGTPVGTIIANDVDQTELSFSITAGNTDNAFTIESTTGILNVDNTTAIDFETNPSFTLTVSVSDGDVNVEATITVNLTDVDEAVNQVPQIVDQSFSIDENSADGTTVGTVASFDPDDDALTYSITAGNTNSAFAIDALTGGLTVANVAELDFETTSTFSLTVQVDDTELNASATITINLNDILDTNQAPTIGDQTFSIAENSANGSAVGSVIASDQNSDALTYSITAGNTNNAFTIDGSSGVLSVAAVAELDFETTPTFLLTVQVADAEFSASATITVNLNDVDESVNQAPQIVAQTFSIDENSSNGTTVGTVASFDPDGDPLTYSITAGNTNSAFALDGSTGALTVADVTELDFETTPTFSLTIQVIDAALNASATITVNLNDLADTNQTPQIADQTFAIDENSANGTIVGTVAASDPDSDALTYSITAGNTNNAFAIDGSTGALTVADVTQLDFETTPTFSLTIQVIDAALNASATITVNLNDLADTNQTPQIADQTFAIDENSANGTSVGTVAATDPDSDALTYSITAGNTNNAFAIDGSTGALTVADVAELDFETTPTFSLTVQVADAEFSASATITVNLNDVDESVNQAPQIVAQTFSIDENSSNGTTVGTVASFDPDGDPLIYSITGGNTNSAFAIDGSTGALTVADVAELDFETTPIFSLTIQVADAALNASATITVNLNDLADTNQTPQIADQTFAIDENSANGTSVGTVVATDADSDALTYSITAGNTNNAFAIEGSTGALTVADVTVLDFETTPTFSLTVQVADVEFIASATITLNLNDVDESVNQAPQIVAQTFTIDENSTNGMSVGTVAAFDPDGDALTYAITAGNTNNAFALDGSTGTLTVADGSQLDFETIPTFSLTVQVADAALNASATITVNLNDLDDTNQAPQIADQTFAIDENSGNGTAVGTVVASDPDSDALTYSITAGNTNSAFALDGSTGALTVADGSQLDFETTPTFSLTVQVADAALNASATITVNLNDLNDTNQAPQIADQTFAIDENSANGTAVGTVVATDPDGDALSYAIIGGNPSNAFLIDSSTGELTVGNSAELDFETTASFALSVLVADALANSTATITINLNDVDENTLGLAEEVQANMKLYPNPAVHKITLEYPDELLQGKWLIVNLEGKKFLSGEIISSKEEIDLTSFRSGLYLIQIEKAGIVFSIPLIKK